MEVRFDLKIDRLKGLLTLDEYQMVMDFREQQQRVEKLMYQHYVDTKDKAVRAGLIALGWTPPPDEQERCGNYAEHGFGKDGKGCGKHKGHEGNCADE